MQCFPHPLSPPQMSYSLTWTCPKCGEPLLAESWATDGKQMRTTFSKGKAAVVKGLCLCDSPKAFRTISVYKDIFHLGHFLGTWLHIVRFLFLCVIQRFFLFCSRNSSLLSVPEGKSKKFRFTGNVRRHLGKTGVYLKWLSELDEKKAYRFDNKIPNFM